LGAGFAIGAERFVSPRGICANTIAEKTSIASAAAIKLMNRFRMLTDPLMKFF
jgi:hypothetical protein